MLGESPRLTSALERLALLAPSDLAILIQGETGTGKELAARRIHRLSPRAKLPFLGVNCAALPESLLLSDLFGHVKGSFTGADRDRAGIFEASRGGTVFLDEIGDLPPAAQAKLLRVLETGEITRVGGEIPVEVDARVVAATRLLAKRAAAERAAAVAATARARAALSLARKAKAEGEAALAVAFQLRFSALHAPAAPDRGPLW